MTQVADAARGTRRVEQIMGMPIAIDLRDEDVDPAALEHAFDWFRFVDATFSMYKDGSEISRLNRGELPLAQAHPDVRAVLERCAELREETSGYFDADAAGGEAGVDPSGLVKGWSVDRAARILETFGAGNFSIDAGGDIVLRGEPSPGRPWRVGIRHPLLPEKLAAVVAARELAIATSATYERGAHILDPHAGAPPTGVLSVTIAGPVLASADAYATAAFAMGAAGAEWAATLPGYEAMTILVDERVLSTPGFPATP